MARGKSAANTQKEKEDGGKKRRADQILSNHEQGKKTAIGLKKQATGRFEPS